MLEQKRVFSMKNNMLNRIPFAKQKYVLAMHSRRARTQEPILAKQEPILAKRLGQQGSPLAPGWSVGRAAWLAKATVATLQSEPSTTQ